MSGISQRARTALGPNMGYNTPMADPKQHRIYLCAGVHCTAAGRDALLRVLEDELWALGIDEAVEVRVSGCQNRCDDAPNATVWPGPYHYSQLTAERLRRIVAEHLAGDRPVEELLHRPASPHA